MSDALHHGRTSFEQHAWSDAYVHFSTADGETPLAPADLERLAVAAFMAGKDADSDDAWARAHHEHLHRGEVERAARCAFWLAFGLLERGAMAPAGGWLSRARRLLDEGGRDCVEHGYVLLPEAVRCVAEGEYAAAYEAFCQAVAIGERFHDRDLITLALHGRGRVLIRWGRTAEAMAVLDEVMAAVLAGEVSAYVIGDLYCGVIEACHETFDLRRAQEWTAALSRWCAAQPDLVAYRGQCLVYRAQLLQLQGAWPAALDLTRKACEPIAQPTGPAVVGAAFYQQAEIHRLRGELLKAEESYRQASRLGQSPQPGLALLRLAQGRIDAAAAAIRRVVDEAPDRVTRSRLLAPQVEIMLAAGDLAAARAAANELAELAAGLDAPFLRALAVHAQGAVLLAEGAAQIALAALRRAWTAWQELNAPYEAARVRVLIGRACAALDDEDSAALELDAAQLTFRQLGAAADLLRVAALSRRPPAAPTGGLTAREVEVLRLLAAGRTNRAIADHLVISEKTVARHVSNIFDKLGVTSRSAATAYAFEHDLR